MLASAQPHNTYTISFLWGGRGLSFGRATVAQPHMSGFLQHDVAVL
jgi:hypothetical protein